MNKASIIVIIAVGILIVGGIAYWYSTPYQPVKQAVESTTPTPTRTPQTPPAAARVTVTYTASGFSPSTITIQKGDTVVFKNTASDGVWVSSNPHPVHTAYPTTGGCIGSTFDACKPIPPGSSWSFTFGVAGTWGYHDHLNPGKGGTIVVQ